MQIPKDEILIMNFLPARSTKSDAQIAPTIWIDPTKIDEFSGDKFEPDFLNIVVANTIIAKHPQNWFNAIKIIP